MKAKELSEKLIAQNCLTYSKRPDQFIEGVYPTHALGNIGDELFCDDSQCYFDFGGGLGVMSDTLEGCYSLPSIIEPQVAFKLNQRIPILEKMKFLKTGSEACLAAVRIARAFNKRELVFGVGYHGWGDMFISAEIPGSGTTLGWYVKFKNLKTLLNKLNPTYPLEDISAIIIEPVMLDLNVKKELKEIRKICTDNGIVLIFDEIITGFRVPDYCIANYFEIQPDLMCLGKQIGGGDPLSVVGGKKELMDNPNYFVSSTFAGEFRALLAAERFLLDNDKNVILKLWGEGIKFIEMFNLLNPKIQLEGYPTRCIWKGDKLTINLFWQEMCKRKILLGKSFFINNYVIRNKMIFFDKAVEAIDKIRTGVVLEGLPPSPVFERN